MQVDPDTIERAMRRMTDDELRLVVTKDAAQYLSDALAIAKTELARRGIEEVATDDVEAIVARKAEEIPVAWLRVYTYGLLLQILISGGDLVHLLGRTHRPLVIGVALVIFALQSTLDLTVFNGLRRRRLWGWQLNWVEIVVRAIVFTAVHGALGAVFVCFWGGANYVYFMKRRHLFK